MKIPNNILFYILGCIIVPAIAFVIKVGFIQDKEALEGLMSVIPLIIYDFTIESYIRYTILNSFFPILLGLIFAAISSLGRKQQTKNYFQENSDILDSIDVTNPVVVKSSRSKYFALKFFQFAFLIYTIQAIMFLFDS